ncbi:MAG: DUF4143 domain-containing protein [Deltaproteobacteria bacterium]|nr:DUF4143 domain-containing protein [Deltaproteobacteria bacterium]
MLLAFGFWDPEKRRAERGRFVVTGSSSPALLKSISESLAGRIAVIEMAPLSWAEIRSGRPSSALEVMTDRAARAGDVVSAAHPRGDVVEAHEFWRWGGYPEPWLRGGEDFRRMWMEQYVRAYLYRDIGRLFPGLDQARFRTFLGLMAGLSGTVINTAEVARSLGVSQPTAADYFEIAHGTFLWRRVPSYRRDAVKRIVKHSKGYVRDSGLLHHLSRIPDLEALLVHPVMGRTWEGLVLEEIIRGLDALGAGFDYYFYRTSAGAEVDLVLEGDFGLIPVEIKYASVVSSRELRGLREFVKERGCRFGLVIGNQVQPRLFDENIAGIPFTAL